MSPLQHGFLQNRSTFSALIGFTVDCATALDKRATLFACSFDFQKAYDSVSHSKLLSKLKSIGISGSLFKFFQSFLLGRTFRVRIGEALSQPLLATSDVPQGSVLAPILFNIFLNDIFETLPSNVKACAYADDLKLWSINRADALQKGIDRIVEWSAKWDLPLNASKTQVFFIGRPSQVTLAIDGRKIEVSETIKDLGLLYDSKMSFGNHMARTYAKAMQRINLIFRAFSTKKVSTLLKLYKSFVLPILEYLSPIWNPSDLGSISKLESIQRKFTKRLYYRLGKPNIPYEKRLAELSLTPLQDRRLIADLVTFYKIIHGQIEPSNPLFFGIPTNRSSRGHSKRVVLHRYTKQKPHSMFHSRIPLIWNKLPSEIVRAENPKVFRKLLTAQINDGWTAEGAD